jgi:hypothetical protein
MSNSFKQTFNPNNIMRMTREDSRRERELEEVGLLVVFLRGSLSLSWCCSLTLPGAQSRHSAGCC